MHSDLDSLRGRLQAIVGRERVEGAARAAAFAVDGILPELVVRPGTQDEVSQVVAACARAGAAMIPWGGGTAMGLGNAPARAQVVLCLDRLDRLVEWDPANLTVTAEAGMSLSALQEVISRDRAILPLDPPAAHRVTLGGLVAANQSGPARLLYGTVRDWLLGMRVVLPDGQRIHCGGRVIKNVSGYDMNKIFISSLGTLGIITEVTFKLLPVPAQRGAVIGLFPGLAQAWAAAKRVQASFLLPEALDLLNPAAVDLLAPTLGLPAAPGTCALAAALAGSPETVERQARELTATVRSGRRNLPVPAQRPGRTGLADHPQPAGGAQPGPDPVQDHGAHRPHRRPGGRRRAGRPGWRPARHGGGPCLQRRHLGPLPAGHGGRPGRPGAQGAGGAAPGGAGRGRQPGAARGPAAPEAPGGRLGLARRRDRHDAAAQG